jgi:hypothetical protein
MSFTKPLRDEELAHVAQMGVSTLHLHSKSLTADLEIANPLIERQLVMLSRRLFIDLPPIPDVRYAISRLMRVTLASGSNISSPRPVSGAPPVDRAAQGKPPTADSGAFRRTTRTPQ